MEKNWITWTSTVLAAVGLIFSGCGEREEEQVTAPSPVEQAQPAPAKEEKVAPTPGDPEAQPKQAGDLIKKGSGGDVIRP